MTKEINENASAIDGKGAARSHDDTSSLVIKEVINLRRDALFDREKRKMGYILHIALKTDTHDIVCIICRHVVYKYYYIIGSIFACR